MVFATLAFLGAFGADQGLLTYFADLSGPGLPYLKIISDHTDCLIKVTTPTAVVISRPSQKIGSGYVDHSGGI